MAIPTDVPLRRIRSYVKRDGRMTEGQRRVLEALWPQFGLELKSGLIDLPKVFGREAPCTLEIGFGSGHSLLEIARANPERDFIGIEMYRSGIGTLLLGVEEYQLQNIRVYYADAVEVLKHCIPAASLSGLQLFFPDPWQKRRHHKRRIIQTEFVNLIAGKLKPEGLLHLATDWENYAEHMMDVLSVNPHFKNLAGAATYSNRSSERPIQTKFEQRGLISGREIAELQFIKI